MKEQSIRTFFDGMSSNRNKHIYSNPILGYEQIMRQRAVMELSAPDENELILDVGCGNGRDFVAFTEKGAVPTGIDFSHGMIHQARQDLDIAGLSNPRLVSADARNLPFKHETFDKVSCSEVIEHVPDWGKVIVEIKRVLKPGGIVVITTPNWVVRCVAADGTRNLGVKNE